MGLYAIKNLFSTYLSFPYMWLFYLLISIIIIFYNTYFLHHAPKAYIIVKIINNPIAFEIVSIVMYEYSIRALLFQPVS